MRFFLLIVLAGLLADCGGKQSDADKPNIVVILSDDQGWGDLSFNGNTNLATPNIDQLAANGASFTNFYVSPVCSPTRAELLTGRYHPRGGVYDTSAGGERLDLDETTIAEVFKSAGYATAAFGKWHNGMQAPYHPNARGFDEYYGFCSGHWGNYFDPMLEHNGQIVKGKGFIIDDLTDHAMKFMEDHRDQPFLVYLPYNTPHGPMQVPDRWWDTFKDKELGMRHRDPEIEDLDFTRAALAMCENIDWNVGRVMEKVSTLGLSEQTIVVYFCDNGPNGWRWNGHMKGRKGSTDEGGVRSPLFISWPGFIRKGIVVDEISAAIDLLPTLANLAGISYTTNQTLDGLSVRPLIFNEDAPWTERMIFSHWNGRVSVRSHRFRLDKQDDLYDMEEDRGQTVPVNDKFSNVRQEMLQAKKQWEREVVGMLPEVDDRPFPIGYPGFPYTQIPARDGVPYGNIERSNQFPNCSFFTNWIDESDSIVWPVEIMESGTFKVEIYYTCAEENLGSTFQLSFGGEMLQATVSTAHDPPLFGMEQDRVPRHNSYVKDFRPWTIGKIYLEKGKGHLKLKALSIPGSQVMDFRLMMLKKISS